MKNLFSFLYHLKFAAESRIQVIEISFVENYGHQARSELEFEKSEILEVDLRGQLSLPFSLTRFNNFAC